MDAVHQHDHDDCGGGSIEIRVVPYLRKTRMIVLYFLISIPFIALYILLIKALEYVSKKNGILYCFSYSYWAALL